MLLTSSQVSVAASSGVVLFFTAALFLSGYAIQQRTLRDLRAAIKPGTRLNTPPPPKIFLPDRFRQATTELSDGTVVVVDPSDGAVEARLQQAVLEVRPTLPEQQQRGGGGTRSQEYEGQTGTKGGKSSGGSSSGTKKQKPISRAERRRRIKEEIQMLAQGTERGYYQRRLY